MWRAIISIVILSCVCLNASFSFAATASDYSAEQFRHERFVKSTLAPAEAEAYFLHASDYFWSVKDTLSFIKSQVNRSDVAQRGGHYNASFDLLFEVLPLSHAISDKSAAVEVHHLLGILYGIYDFDSIALQQTKMAHALLRNECLSTSNARLISSYLDVAVRYIDMEDYPQAIVYLDSCYLINETQQRLHFIDAYYAYVYSQLKNYPKAKDYFTGLEAYFEHSRGGFVPTLYYFLAQYYLQQKMHSTAISYYEKAIMAIDDRETYLNIKPEILNTLASLYFARGSSTLAYQTLEKSKRLSDSLYTTQSRQNRTLFEIKNRYKEDLVQKEEIIAAQSNLLEARRKATSRLKLLIAFLVLIGAVVAFALRLRYKMRHLAKAKELNERQNAEMLEFKNKELTANALQMVEKEQDIKELLEALKLSSPDRYKVLNRKLRHSNKKIWSDFNLRFTQTNSAFYSQLQTLYPELTPTDLKHCALVRLHFNSKEMSDLLGISVNSVHMARSRIRKKMGLKRSESLAQFLGAF